MAPTKFSFRKHQSRGLRLWHWANSVVILGLLSTVLIRKTFLSWRTNSVVIEEKLKAAGNPITPELAKEIAVAIRDPLWDWHIYLGFALGLLLLVRVFVAVFVEREAPGVAGIRIFFGLRNTPVSERRHALHHSFVKIGYLVFYLVTALMVATGVLLTFDKELSLSKGFAGSMKAIHEFMMWFFVAFVAGHIVGIVIAENRTDQGLVSDMIYGGKPD